MRQDTILFSMIADRNFFWFIRYELKDYNKIWWSKKRNKKNIQDIVLCILTDVIIERECWSDEKLVLTQRSHIYFINTYLLNKLSV